MKREISHGGRRRMVDSLVTHLLLLQRRRPHNPPAPSTSATINHRRTNLGFRWRLRLISRKKIGNLAAQRSDSGSDCSQHRLRLRYMLVVQHSIPSACLTRNVSLCCRISSFEIDHGAAGTLRAPFTDHLSALRASFDDAIGRAKETPCLAAWRSSDEALLAWWWADGWVVVETLRASELRWVWVGGGAGGEALVLWVLTSSGRVKPLHEMPENSN